MSKTYFFTGYPGFIASTLIKHMLENGYHAKQIYLLVQQQFLEKAKLELEKLKEELHIEGNLFTLVTGDITKSNLDIDTPLQEVTHVFHLAAVYDLAVPEKIAQTVNVEGTRNMNDWVQTLPKLERYVYFSTAYVAGKREGRILEAELEMNQNFKNHYEHTKYEAEVLVKKLLDQGLPVTIIRPGIVVGDSITGKTTKFDGPYFMLIFFDRLKFFPFIPYLGKGQATGNFVPIDYILKATVYLAHADQGARKTYHLTDPNPYRVKDVYRTLMEELLGRKPLGTIPLSVARWFLSIRAFRKWTRVEKEALDYFSCMAEYDSTQAQEDLKGSGITCPDFKVVITPMVQFYKQHKNDSSKHIKIR
ncbi:NAD-dependent epimerase/dehydratase family protein [Siminovitchia acidinfaciens]|uniref:NAD-dependent epimerase/dehydratase family protein n=1 Tax=Siminovitchia acidinfaciens TaxID=2321395 RepID=A0A429Y6T3_9BACI|nr:SDR family oxidoreductase [Siminovitchia acidinfaciens]RST77167.1 NAD-dependent epimerase/dehydratase family protein [Siminovitchia acidinfaciens]